MELKGRLRLIAIKTPKCSTLCDIGTDHAYIPIYLIQNSVCRKAIAVDVRKGPLDAAKENIVRYGLKDRIETRLGNGLEPIAAGEVESIIIAGMGGNLISEILHRGLQQAKEAKSLILQPMNDIDIIRKWLYDNGFEIFDEELVEEGTKIYNIICAKWTGKNTDLSDTINYHIGKKLLERKDPLLEKLISRKINQLEKAVIELKSASNVNQQILDNYNHMLKELHLMRANL